MRKYGNKESLHGSLPEDFSSFNMWKCMVNPSGKNNLKASQNNFSDKNIVSDGGLKGIVSHLWKYCFNMNS